jgi:hypothetical protein
MCAKKAVAAPAIQTVNANRNMVRQGAPSILSDPESDVVVNELIG